MQNAESNRNAPVKKAFDYFCNNETKPSSGTIIQCLRSLKKKNTHTCKCRMKSRGIKDKCL